MKAYLLKRGDTFTYNEKRRIATGMDDQFVICRNIPEDGYTVYILREAEVEVEVKDETFRKNPDHRSEMY